MEWNRRLFYTYVVTAGVLAASLTVLVLTNQAGFLDRWGETSAEEASPVIHAIFSRLNLLGSGKVLAPIAIVFVLIIGLVHKKWLQAAMMFMGVLFGYGVNLILKSMVARERPEVNKGAEGFSFPSGHAMVSLIVVVFAFYFLHKQARSATISLISGCLGFMLVLLIGVSRVFEGAHYLSDVLAGFTYGLVFVGGVDSLV